MNKGKKLEVDNFRKISQRRIHGIKNHLIWIQIHREIKEQILVEFPNAKREKIKIKSKN